MRRFTSGKQKTITTSDNVIINYEIDTQDKKRVLVFIHGLGADLTVWDHERLFFKEFGFTTMAIDLRGHGLSGRPGYEEAYNLRRMTTDIHEILKHEKVEGAIIIGHCLGAIIGVLFETQYKSEAKALVLIGTTYKPVVLSNFPMGRQVLHKVLSSFARHMPEKYVHGYKDIYNLHHSKTGDFIGVIDNILHTSVHDYLFIWEDFIDLDLKKAFQEISVSTLILAGANDEIFPQAIAKEMHHRIKKSLLEFVPNAKHFIILNNPMEVCVDIHQFLKR